MRNRQDLSISIDDYLTLPERDLAKFHSGSSLELLLCAYLTAGTSEEADPIRIHKHAELFRLALKSELEYASLTSQEDRRFFLEVLPYTIAMTTKGAELDALLAILIEEFQLSRGGEALPPQLDLEKIRFVVHGTPISGSTDYYSEHNSKLADQQYTLILRSFAQTDSNEESSANEQLLDTYQKELNAGIPFSHFVRQCAHQLELPQAPDNRYLEAIATFVESIYPANRIESYVLQFILDQLSSSAHFFNERLSKTQLFKLRHMYLEELAYEIRSEDDEGSFERESDIEHLLGLENISDQEILWITDVSLDRDVYLYNLTPSDQLLGLAAAHVIFVSSRCDQDIERLDPLDNSVFSQLLPGTLLNTLGIQEKDDIRKFRIAWGSEAFGALFKSLHESWYSGGINGNSQKLAATNEEPLTIAAGGLKPELLAIAFEDAIRPHDDFLSATISWNYLREHARALPSPDWIASGIRETFADHGLIPGELAPIIGNSLEIFAVIQAKLNDNQMIAAETPKQDPHAEKAELMKLVTTSLKQRGSDITVDELRLWLRQQIIDGLGDWRVLRGNYNEDWRLISLAQKFAGVDILDLSEWETDSILSRFISLSMPNEMPSGLSGNVIESKITSFCDLLKLKADNLNTMLSAKKLLNLFLGHPYGEYPTGFFDSHTHVKLRALSETFDILLQKEEALAAARRIIRACFMNSLDEAKNKSAFLDDHIFLLIHQLSIISDLSEPTVQLIEIFDEAGLKQELESLNPTNAHHKKTVNKFLRSAKEDFTEHAGQW